jgi:hypothetical protein
MAITEIKMHVTLTGMKELEHLLNMLRANVDVLPIVVVSALNSLADSVNQSEENETKSEYILGIDGKTHTHSGVR